MPRCNVGCNMSELRMGYWTEKNRIWVTFDYNTQLKEDLKQNVQGARWEPKQFFWHFPLDMQVARDIRKVALRHNFNVTVTGELAKWAKEEKARYSNLLKPDDLAADVSGWLPHLRTTRPQLIAAMEAKPWQIPGAAFMVGQKECLLADEPGLGKTIQTLATIAELDIRGMILVVAPRTAVNVTWPDEIAKWLGPEHVFVINSSLKPLERKSQVQTASAMADVGERVWVICGPNYLRAQADLDDHGNYARDEQGKKILRVVNEGVADLFRQKWQAVIVDESHQTLAGATGNVKKQSAQRQGLGLLDIAPGGLKIAISGTPFRGKTENLWGTLNWLRPKVYTSYWNWIKRHYGQTVDHAAQFGSGIVKGDTILDEQRFFSELRPIMVRRTMAEVNKDMPPLSYGGTRLRAGDETSPMAVWLPMSRKQQKQYDSVVNEALIYLDDMVTMNVNGCLAEMVRFKQIANSCLGTGDKPTPVWPSNKAEWIEDFLVDRISSGTKVIVASQFTSFLEVLSKHLATKGIQHYLFTGKTSDPERKRIKDEFQSAAGDMVILLNTKSGGVSLTLDLADDVVVCDQTYVPDDQEQVEKRAYRISRNHHVTVWNLASLGTIDEDMAVINAKRSDAIGSILDGQRGVDYVRKLLKLTKDRQLQKAS